MKKFWYSSVLALSLVLLQACKENEPVPATAQQNQLDEQISVAQARQIFEQYQLNDRALRAGTKKKFEKKPKWDYAQKEKFIDGREVILAPVDTEVADYEYAVVSAKPSIGAPKTAAEVFTTHKVVVYKDKGKDKVELMSVFGEVDYKRQHTYLDYDSEFTGALLFRTLDGDFLRGVYYERGKKLGIIEPSKSNLKNGRPSACYVIHTLTTFYYTVTVGPYTSQPQSNGDVRDTYQVICDDAPQGGYPNTYNAGAGGSSSSGSAWSSNNAAMQMVFEQKYRVRTPDNLIVNVPDYLKCFDANTGSNYKVTLNIDQPVGGTGIALNPFADGNHWVGHAFLTLEQTNANGQVIRRSIGFYPGSGESSINNSNQNSGMGNDAIYSGGWNVQVIFGITGSEMATVTNFLSNYGSNSYQLFSRNCGNMCTDALSTIGINLPMDWTNQVLFYSSSYSGSGTAVRGPSIGAFGQQMTTYQHSKVVSRSTSGGTPSSNQGSCN